LNKTAKRLKLEVEIQHIAMI